MDERGYYIARAALTVAILGLPSSLLVDEVPDLATIPLAFIAVLFLTPDLIRGGFLVGIMPTGVARLLLRQPSVSTRRKDGLTLTVRLRWHDEVGRPIVTVDNGRVRAVWASLDIEVRNHHRDPQRVSDLFLEIRTARFPRRLIATGDPVAIDNDAQWHRAKFPRRVEWLLDPVSPAVVHHVRFNRGWMEGDPSAPRDPRRFTAYIVASLVRPSGRQVRVELGDDIIA